MESKAWLRETVGLSGGLIREGFIDGEHGMVAESHASVLGSNFVLKW